MAARGVAALAEGDPSAHHAAARRPVAPGADAATFAALTPREREVVELVAHGLTNDEIAGASYLSPLTAKTHVNRSMMKVGARDRAQLVVFAYQAGLAALTPYCHRSTPQVSALGRRGAPPARTSLDLSPQTRRET